MNIQTILMPCYYTVCSEFLTKLIELKYNDMSGFEFESLHRQIKNLAHKSNQ